MSELDLGLKIGTRSLLWSMGYSTRLDVELRGARSPHTGKSPESFTDLDVLGVQLTTGQQLITAIADCKTGRADRPTARMFWARGVADLFRADQIFLVREHDVNDGVRQLAGRLDITVLPSADLGRMQQLHGATPSDQNGPLALLFDRTTVASHLDAFTGLDRRLKPLLEYRQFDYWIYEDHRNLGQLVAHVQDAAAHLDPRNPIHVSLFFDLAWLYLLALVRVTQYIRRAFMADVDRGLQEYLFGGSTGVQEKKRVAEQLSRIRPEGQPEVTHLPPFYSHFRELVARLLRRPAEMQTSLRYAEVATALAAARQRTTLRSAFSPDFDVVAAKLLADVCGFIVAATNLHPDFRTQARAYLLEEPVANGSGRRPSPADEQERAPQNPVPPALTGSGALSAGARQEPPADAPAPSADEPLPLDSSAEPPRS